MMSEKFLSGVESWARHPVRAGDMAHEAIEENRRRLEVMALVEEVRRLQALNAELSEAWAIQKRANYELRREPSPATGGGGES